MMACPARVQVESSSESGSPRTSLQAHAGGAAVPFADGSDGNGLTGADGTPPLPLSDWRLRVALSSEQDYQVC
jgi:hypothetical protein